MIVVMANCWPSLQPSTRAPRLELADSVPRTYTRGRVRVVLRCARRLTGRCSRTGALWSLRSLVRPPLNGSIVRRTGRCMLARRELILLFGFGLRTSFGDSMAPANKPLRRTGASPPPLNGSIVSRTRGTIRGSRRCSRRDRLVRGNVQHVWDNEAWAPIGTTSIARRAPLWDGSPDNKPLQQPSATPARSELGSCRDAAGCARGSSRPATFDRDLGVPC